MQTCSHPPQTLVATAGSSTSGIALRHAECCLPRHVRHWLCAAESSLSPEHKALPFKQHVC